MSQDEPLLMQHIKARRCQDAIERISTHPEEAQFMDNLGYTCLHFAMCVEYNSIELIKRLIEAWPSATSVLILDHHATPLHIACQLAPLPIIKILLDSYPEASNIRNVHFQRPIDALCCRNNLGVPERSTDLLSGAFENAGKTLFWRLSCELVKAMSCSSNNAGWKHRSGRTLLHTCAQMNDASCPDDDMLKYCPTLVLRYAVVMHPEHLVQGDDGGNTPLHLAAMCSNLDSISCIGESDPAAAALPNNNGSLPLHIAIRSGNTWDAGVRHLVQYYPHGVTISDRATRLYPFMLAAVGKGASLDLVFRLLRLSPDLNQFSGRHGEDDRRKRRKTSS